MLLEQVMKEKRYEAAKKDNERNQKLIDASKENYLRTKIILTEEARNLDNIKEKILTDFKKIDGKNFLNLRVSCKLDKFWTNFHAVLIVKVKQNRRKRPN